MMVDSAVPSGKSLDLLIVLRETGEGKITLTHH